MRRCPDEGACHHDCGDGPCWRVLIAGPLSAADYPRDDWPPEVKAAHGAVVPRQADRRQAPRRAEDVALHYAREGLLAAALAVADFGAGAAVPTREWVLAHYRLGDAAERYREAEAAARVP